MILLVAIDPREAEHAPDSAPHVGQHGEPVSPKHNKTWGWFFMGLHSGQPCGQFAETRDREDIDVFQLAVLDAHVTGSKDLDDVRATLWQNLCWLHGYGDGTPIELTRDGVLRLDYANADPELLRVIEWSWADDERADGRVPFLAQTEEGWKRGSLEGMNRLVDVSVLLAAVRHLDGFETTDHLLPL